MKAELLTINDENDDELYIDFFFNEEHINGFYITPDNYIDNSVNIFFHGQLLTFKRTKELEKYLIDRFNQ